MTTKLPWIKLAEPNGPPLEEHKDKFVLVYLEDRGWANAIFQMDVWHILEHDHSPDYISITRFGNGNQKVTHYCPIDTDTSEAVHIDKILPFDDTRIPPSATKAEQPIKVGDKIEIIGPPEPGISDFNLRGQFGVVKKIKKNTASVELLWGTVIKFPLSSLRKLEP